MVVWGPDWPVVVGGLPGPVAVVEGGRVLACSQPARQAGVRRRMPVRQAQARCAGLQILARDRAAEARAFERVARVLEQVTPRLEVLRPGLVALPEDGPARYAGDRRALARRIGELLDQEAVTGCVGSAQTLFAAALAARRSVLVPGGATARFLEPHPVGVLGRPRLAELLVRLGVETLGAFAALPAGQVLGRFGSEGAAAQRVARGLELRPLDTRVPSRSLSAAEEFDPPADLMEPLVFAASRLAEQLHQQLAGAGAVCGQVEITARLVGGRELTRVWRHEGRLSTLALAERVRWQLQAWEQAGELGESGGAGDPLLEEGITELRLVPHQLGAATGRQGALWGQEGLEELERTAARLQARLGLGAVVRVRLTGGRGPGERVERVPFGDVVEPRPGGEGPWPGQLPGPHPTAVYPVMPGARLLDEAGFAVSVTGRSEVSAVPAVLHVQGRRALAVTGWSGPWTVDEAWWDPAQALRAARLLAVTDGGAWLLRLERAHWWVEAWYG